MLERLDEVEKNFYNRLESARLIKKQGHIPFTEHMSISKSLLLYLYMFYSSQIRNRGSRIARRKR